MTVTRHPKKIKALNVKPAAKDPSKAKKLSKSDPSYFSKIGSISAAKRQMSSEVFSAMAKLSHKNRPKSGYKGGRKPKPQDLP